MSEVQRISRQWLADRLQHVQARPNAAGHTIYYAEFSLPRGEAHRTPEFRDQKGRIDTLLQRLQHRLDAAFPNQTPPQAKATTAGEREVTFTMQVNAATGQALKSLKERNGLDRGCGK